MNAEEASQASLRIASDAARRLVLQADEVGLDWAGQLITCELVVAIVVGYLVRARGYADPVQGSTELIDALTEHAHRRVLDYLVRDAGGAGP